ncbi:MAG: beta-lactamase family protein [Candidatus Eremiobacteraeota bacterium]|nr:beta-lactamase family protein [Candidatus Eremiobacteraeota bacterium]
MAKVASLDLDAAASYARKHTLHALVVATANDILYETYESGYTADTPHAIYSGTKSFWGTAALCAVKDKLFELDEPVVRVIPEFAGDIRRAVTPRMLLSMTAGYGFGGLGASVPTYEKVLTVPLKNRPGETFTYGGIPLQVFGAFFARVLQPHEETPHSYLQRRVLDHAHVGIDEWRTLSDGTHPLPTGVQLHATEWLAYGRYMLRHVRENAEALHGSQANVRYGLGWWLAPAGVPDDTFYASGSAGQGLYVIPSRDLVVVHFAKSTSYKHDVLLKRLLT